MTEHEKLKEICDLIGYKNKYVYFDKYYNTFRIYEDTYIEADVREIIFTIEFIEKYVKYLDNENLLGKKRNYENIGVGIIFNLRKPVEYLYNLIVNYENKK